MTADPHSPPPPPSGPLVVVDGEVHILFAFDLGLAIDLDAAERLLTPVGGVEGREAIGTAQRTPEYFEFRPAPLRVTRAAPPTTIAGLAVAERVECVLYDFGAVSLSYRLPITGPIDNLIELADELYENALLLADARRQIEDLARQIEPAVQRPGLSPLVEDYVIYHLRAVESPDGLHACLERSRATIARILRAERGTLSHQETTEALASVMSYSPTDALIVDWNAALVIQEPAQDILTVLEFSNVELLEVRFLDDRLDAMLDRTYESSLASRGRRGVPGSLADMRRIAGLQMDAALLFESINNSLKLLGDQYLARVYRLAAQRFHLADWDASIQRKVSTLEGVYRKIADEQAARRMEMLEWIVIILIAVEIVLSLIRWH